MRRYALVFVCAPLCGCDTVGSTKVSTDKIKPSFDVKVETYQGGSTYIGAILGQPDSLSNVRLEAGDAIGASSDKDPSIALPYDSTLQIYSTLMDKVTDRSSITIQLTRSSGVSAKSTVQLPPAIALTAPPAMAQVPFANGSGTATFKWSNPVANGTVSVIAFPSCDPNAVQASSLSTSGSDNGSLDVSTSKLLVSAPASAQCVLVRLARTVNGQLDPAFAPKGTFTGERYDYTQIVVTP